MLWNVFEFLLCPKWGKWVIFRLKSTLFIFVLRYSLAFILKLYLMTDMTVCKNNCFELWMKIHAMLEMRQMGQVIKPGVNSFFEIVWNLKYSRLFASYIKLDLLCKLSVLNSIGEVIPNTWYQRTRFKQ